MTDCPRCSQPFDPAATGGTCPRCALAAALTSAAPAGPADDYEFIAELGRGGMGMVSLVRQSSLDRLVALKVIATAPDPDGRAEIRLLREARAAAAISHPHVVAVHEVGKGASGAFIAMEYCEGGDLRERLRAGPLAPRAAAELVRKLADAVARAHAAGVLHRDLKPSNVLLTAAGEPKLSDFGLSGSVASVEATGIVAGSPAYLAPEALQAGHHPAPAQDIYGLGAVLYECVTGRAPFLGESAPAVLAQIPQGEPPPPRLLNRAVTRDLETIILKCLEKKPAARYATAADLRDDLGRLLAGHPIHARPVSAAGRAWRWSRRHPARATAIAASLLLLLTVAVGSSIHAFRLEHEQQRTAAERDRATQAEAATREQWRKALLAQAQATRLTGRQGQRFAALAAIREAAAIRPAADARTAAVAALSLPDWSANDETNGLWTEKSPHTAATPLPGFQAFIHETEAGVFSRRTFPAGRIEWTWPGVGSPRAGATVVSPDGRWVAVRLQNDEIHVLDAGSGAPVFQLANRPFAFKASRFWGYGTDMAFSPDGTRFAATRPEGGVSIHQVPGGQLAAEWNAPEWIVALAFSHDGRRLAAGGSKERGTNVLAVIDPATGATLARSPLNSRADFVAWSEDDRWLATGTRPLEVRGTSDLALRAMLPEFSALHGRFLPDGRRLLVSEQIGQTRLWDIDRGRLLLAKADSGRPGVWFDGAPLRQWRHFSSGPVVLQTFHETEIFRALWPPLREYTLPAIVDPLDVSPDGRWVMIGGWAGPTLLHLASGRWHRPDPEGGPDSLSTARFDPSGEALWTGQTKGPLRRHALTFRADAAVISAGEIIPGHEGFLPTALHPGSGVMALADYYGGRYRLLDTRTRAVVAEWPIVRAGYATFSPDGRLLLTSCEAGKGNRVEIREVATGRLVKTLAEAAGETGAWSPDGQWVLASYGPSVTKLWRVADWTPGPALPAEAQGFSRRAAYSPDGRLLAINENNFIWLLRADTGEEILRLEAPEQNRFSPSLRFTPDGRTLIVPRLDGSLHLWSLSAIRTELGKLGLDWRD